MATEVRMPKIGLSEGDMVIVSWERAPGDSVKKGDVIAVVEGDKLTSDLEAETDGILGEHLVPEGEEVKINTLLTTIT